MKLPHAIFFATAFAGIAAADDRVDAVTNRLNSIIGTSNYTFSVAFGKQGLLTIEGYMAGTSTALIASFAGTELLRASDGRIWFDSAGTDTAVEVAMDYPLHLLSHYNDKYSATLMMGIMPPTGIGSFLMAGYDGVAGRIQSLPRVSQSGSGWRFCETNETGTCIEIYERASPARANVTLLKTQDDKSSVFIHELIVAAGAPVHAITLPVPKRIVHLGDFSVALTFCSNISSAMVRAAATEESQADIVKKFGRFIDYAVGGGGGMPPFPPAFKRH